MPLMALKNFQGSINGKTISLKQGEIFMGDKRAVDYLKNIGILGIKKVEKKGESK